MKFETFNVANLIALRDVENVERIRQNKNGR